MWYSVVSKKKNTLFVWVWQASWFKTVILRMNISIPLSHSWYILISKPPVASSTVCSMAAVLLLLAARNLAYSEQTATPMKTVKLTLRHCWRVTSSNTTSTRTETGLRGVWQRQNDFLKFTFFIVDIFGRTWEGNCFCKPLAVGRA